MTDQEILKRATEYVAKEREPVFRSEVEALIEKQSWADLEDRFYKGLSFGTGGMRGVIGGGFNRMNPYNVRRITQGLANYILAQNREEPSVAIAHDSRRYSDLFALEAALVLCANGIRVYLTPSLRSTPQLSFMVRNLRATAGIVVTASHNPPEYNGYKVYWEDGAQVVTPDDEGIVQQVGKVGKVLTIGKEQALAAGLLSYTDQEMDERFWKTEQAQSLRPELVKQHGADLKVVYTPLHGTGGVPVSTVLGRMGLDVVFVPEQKEPDGEFPTVESPNPEEASALAMALDLGRKTGADLVMGTDPDSDRLGVAIPGGGDFVLITGNQLGALLMDYILSTHVERGTLPPRAVVMKTIVTTELHRSIADSYGIPCMDTLTGFKFMGQRIREFEQQVDGPQYVFGSEESYGYLIGTAVRDKDAISAAVLTAEMTLFHKSRGKTLLDALGDIYDRHGYYQEMLVTKQFPGQQGFAGMIALMDRLRLQPPTEWAGIPVVLVRDYQEGKAREPRGGREEDLDFPRSNVLQWVLDDGAVITARPSGTEPKIKFYASCHARPDSNRDTAVRQVGDQIKAIEQQVAGLL